jgi:hypothetical protein
MRPCVLASSQKQSFLPHHRERRGTKKAMSADAKPLPNFVAVTFRGFCFLSMIPHSVLKFANLWSLQREGAFKRAYDDHGQNKVRDHEVHPPAPEAGALPKHP